jgi:predicted metal-dependent RNase
MAEVSISHFKRSFYTNMYNLGLPILTIMAFSGHKTEKKFRKYTNSKNEEHRKIMRGYW